MNDLINMTFHPDFILIMGFILCGILILSRINIVGGFVLLGLILYLSM
jgi:hypothetical protein